jgi:hypothetical protein
MGAQAPIVVRIQGHGSDRWTLEIPGRASGGTFIGLKSALTFAKGECKAAPAAIELWVAGTVCVIHQDRGWPKSICSERRAERFPDDRPGRGAVAWQAIAGAVRRLLGASTEHRPLHRHQLGGTV